MDSLRQKLENQGLVDVNYMVVNHQGAQAQRLHSMLTSRLSSSIKLFKQGDQDADVWQALNGEKDDFLIYDRCGRLTYHISLPYSIIGQGHVENAIRATYCTRICGDCSHEGVDIPEACTRPVEARPDTPPLAAVPAVREEDTPHRGEHGHHGHHGHGHHHGGGPEQSATGDAALLLLLGGQRPASGQAHPGLAQPDAQAGQVMRRP